MKTLQRIYIDGLPGISLPRERAASYVAFRLRKTR
ncbi:hypothetical protein PF66_05070 [Pseudomonas asplenii]|uniref:Uncharacterized protein n=1 Tax=Pseudomonas asplenii TaxID=53407 RepID=A0A0M9GDX0_9PSED|nr:hypothetical protein PF66_05070 [Pseudomonas fuscovaginae]KPA93880.1 hypothetical protein PF70_06170 [Pseudomonas fuscovaginae]